MINDAEIIEATKAANEAAIEIEKIKADTEVEIVKTQAETETEIVKTQTDAAVEVAKTTAEPIPWTEILDCLHRIEDCVIRMEKQGESEMAAIEALLSAEAHEQSENTETTEGKDENKKDEDENEDEKTDEVLPARRRKLLWY